MRTTSLAAALGGSLLAIIGVAAFVQPAEEVTEVKPARFEPIVRTELVCPYAVGQGDAASEIALLAIPEVDITDDESKVVATPLAGPDAKPGPLLELAERGPIVSAKVKSSSPIGHVVRAQGSLAAGLVGEQTMSADGADVRGRADVRCAPPTREAWFVGASGQVGHRDRLVLTNPGGAAALVDLTLWDNKGEVKAPAAQDISVPPRGERAVLLDALAPESDLIAVRAVAARGRVGMAMELRESKGADAMGVTWVGGAAAPSTELYLAAMPGQGDRTLQVLAPGNSDAIVKISLRGPQGSFKPAGHEVVTVPAGTVAEVPLTDAASDQAVAVDLSSDVPVTGVVRVTVSAAKGTDIAYSSPVETLQGPTASLHARSGGGYTSALLLTNVTDEPASAVVRTLTADGTPAREQEVEVPPGVTQAIEVVSPDKQQRLAVIVYPQTIGALTASRVVTGTGSAASFVDVLALPTAPVTVQVPDVSWELSTGLSADPSSAP